MFNGFPHSDQDELEERVERLNRATLKVITKSLGLSKVEQHQKVWPICNREQYLFTLLLVFR